jgi:hypothetical protein
MLLEASTLIAAMSMDQISIPGPFKFFKTHDVPPIDVELPMTVSARRTMLVAFGIFSIVFGISCLLIAAGIAQTALFGTLKSGVRQSIPPFAICLLVGLWFTAFSITCINIARRARGVLQIQSDGVWDQMQDVFVDWDNVTHAAFKTDRSGLAAVALDLQRPVKRRVSWFDYTTFPRLSLVHRITIPIKMMDKEPYVIAHTIAALVRHHGGTSETTQWGWK